MMATYLIFNKPFQVLTQFTDNSDRRTLADFIDVPNVYGAGRLDFDSEGLLLLTDDGALINSVMHPSHKVTKTYLAQVEGVPDATKLRALEDGVVLRDGRTAPCEASVINQPSWVWPRTPPIRERQSIPTSWIKITITEGKNRQVRRMTAHIGHPTLRLIRSNIGQLDIGIVKTGEYKEVTLDFLEDNGIKIQTKKSRPSSASRSASKPQNGPKRSGQPQRRNPRPGNRNRTT